MEKQDMPPPPYPAGNVGYPPAPYPTGDASYQPAPYPVADASYQPGPYAQQPSYAPPAYPPPQGQVGYPQQAGYQPVAQGYPEKGGMYPPNVNYGQSPNVNYGQSPNTVIVSQPATVVINPQQPLPSATGAICFSCFVFLCCCWPLGCVAFIFAIMATSTQSAVEASQKIGISNKISIAGVVCGIILLIFIIIAEMSSSGSHSGY